MYTGLTIVLVDSARRVDVARHVNEITSRFGHLRTRRSTAITKREVEQSLGLEEEEHLEIVDSIETSDGTIKTRYQETYKGLPVIGESLVLESYVNGKFTGSATGSLVEGLEKDLPDVEPSLDVETAVGIAVKYEDRPNNKISYKTDRDVRLAVHLGSVVDDVVQVDLAYEVTLLVISNGGVPPSRPQFLLNAHTGQIIRRIDTLEGHGLLLERRRLAAIEKYRRNEYFEITGVGGNNKTGPQVYGKDFESMIVRTDGGKCIMENDIVKLIDMKSTTDPTNKTVFEFQCDERVDDAINGAYSPITDSYFFFCKTFEMFHEWYNMTALKHKTSLYAHYDIKMENAFYGGYEIYIGDGGDRMFPLVVANVLGHEICHGVTAEHADLVYQKESGAMNEAFSDMCGITLEIYISATTDWRIGSTIMKDDTSFRYMDNPTLDDKSIKDAADLCPGMDVHYSSGVYNYVFYLLANYPGWSARKAFHVFIIANRMYWTPTSTFVEGACGTVKAAADLGFSVDDVTRAFRAVNIEPCQPKQFGISNNFALSISKGKSLSFELSLKDENTGMITVQTRKVSFDDTTGNVTLILEGSEVSLVSNRVGYKQDISFYHKGEETYDVILQGSPSFTDVRLYTILTTTPVITDRHVETNNSDGHYDQIEFEVTQEELDEEGELSLAIRTSVSHTHYGVLTSWKTRVDVHSSSYQASGCSIDDDGNNEALYCRPKPGKYYLAIMFYDPEYAMVYSASYSILKTLPRK